MPTRPHIWLVDDDPDVRFIFERTLATAGFRVSAFEDGEAALAQLKTINPALVVLDVNMPGFDGWKTLRELRRRSYSNPILMLTSVDDPDSRVRGLDAGADDYLGKPCTHAEFLARVRALLRRVPHKRLPPSHFLNFGGITVDLEAKTATRNGAPVRLTRTDYSLLTVLWEQIGKAVPRDKILGRVWEGQGGGSHALDTHLWRLRKKLGDDSDPPEWIQSQAGVGYRLSPDVLEPQKPA
ncbi:MAG TPA: response regulator transcription factor [Opitutaceae bacterium]|jgi:DNA-binding response OmpR family regulator|nr:response regulator transcription factor [Opitutaceae bacterium]